MLFIDDPMRTAPQPHYQHSRYGKPIISYYGWGGQLVTGMGGNLQPGAVMLVDVREAQCRDGVGGITVQYPAHLYSVATVPTAIP